MSNKKKLTIAQELKKLMLERGEDSVWSGDPDLCIDAYIRFGGTCEHPLDRIAATIAAARRSKLFKHDGYIRCHDCNGTRQIKLPIFKLIDEVDENE